MLDRDRVVVIAETDFIQAVQNNLRNCLLSFNIQNAPDLVVVCVDASASIINPETRDLSSVNISRRSKNLLECGDYEEIVMLGRFMAFSIRMDLGRESFGA